MSKDPKDEPRLWFKFGCQGIRVLGGPGYKKIKTKITVYKNIKHNSSLAAPIEFFNGSPPSLWALIWSNVDDVIDDIIIEGHSGRLETSFELCPKSLLLGGDVRYPANFDCQRGPKPQSSGPSTRGAGGIPNIL